MSSAAEMSAFTSSPLASEHSIDPRLRAKRQAFLSHPRPATKRIKVEDGKKVEQDTHGIRMNSSRSLSPDRSNSARMQDVSRSASAIQSMAPASDSTSRSTPFGSIPTTSIPTGPKKALPTRSKIVRRQWDVSADNQDYETLLEARRQENPKNVDRYVPSRLSTPNKPSVPSRLDMRSESALDRDAVQSSPRPSTTFRFLQLPEEVRDRILTLLLVKSDGPICIDFLWLRSFVVGKVRVRSISDTINHDGALYHLPVSQTKLLIGIKQMQHDMEPFRIALEHRGKKMRGLRAPCRNLTTSLLKVSRQLHQDAARIFYSQNTFHFPDPSNAWMQLESFLATIEPNAALIRKLRVHVPLWHRGVSADCIEGATLDLLTPASKIWSLPPEHDRLLSAIKYVHAALTKAKALESLELHVSNTSYLDAWIGT